MLAPFGRSPVPDDKPRRGARIDQARPGFYTMNFARLVRDNPEKSMPLSGPRQIGTSSLRLSTSDGCRHQPWRNTIIKIMVLLHSADGLDWQLPPKGTSVKTLYEAEEQGFITMRGEFQKRQFRLTALGAEHVERDRRRLEARKR